MGRPSQAVLEMMEKFSIASDEVWEVRAGGAWAIKHSALERIAAEQKIVFDRPAVLQIDLDKKTVALVVFATMGDRSEWATGEAAPYNNKNGYPVAMAEKRAKDRCVLKLLSAHGALYSEAEAEEFKEERAPTLAKKDAKDIYVKLQDEMRKQGEGGTAESFIAWMKDAKSRIEVLPDDWQGTFRTQCRETLDGLKMRAA